ncbi:Two-component system response regulator [Cupriavidus taiwanensis]|uniref:Two-component system response regulator n=1 Tax=Cupriavidus taiwanensis TaxID=164546 RepID=A0A976B2W6_9BURK|nr:response regulator transcription factor [Cupriavidus taiwanensis]SOZ68539.1 Two-component system response regulator [Cupriavidus taiwanensis]SOZ69701.1 Two-component system response regulator [Cupriavidus taiwanensis]SOZ72910.1 Two-component system response regulator [Cupriavidus taiwanensis]SPA03850.1 Two-component system response regulator [Cupriavidus taiwanensis]SPA09768.1 Two-component system response regulator [Cupriavidus taiwanensis]
MIRIVLVDDHTIFREGLKRLLLDEGDFSVVAEACNGPEALSAIRTHAFDVLVLDISMPGRSGLDLIPSIRSEKPLLPIVVLSMYPAEQYAVRAFEAGASGYVTKDMDAVELVASIRKVVQGKRYFSPQVAEKVMDNLDRVNGKLPHRDLSSREYEIMRLIVQGVRLTEIGKQSFLSVKTVSTYRSRILKKIGVSTNAELVQYALRHKLID